MADSFFQQLATIQTETRRKLREAKSTGTIFSSNLGWLGYFAISETKLKFNSIFLSAEKEVEEQRSQRRIRDDIATLLFPTKIENTNLGSCKLNRRSLTPMNVSQLQIILNYLLTQIETLNENLVQFLMTRDELAIEQDSLLTDIEDITKCIQGHDMSPF